MFNGFCLLFKILTIELVKDTLEYQIFLRCLLRKWLKEQLGTREAGHFSIKDGTVGQLKILMKILNIC